MTQKIVAIAMLFMVIGCIGLRAEKRDYDSGQLIAEKYSEGNIQTKIWNIIKMSKEANLQNGIKDPNCIFPGQKLTFLFEDGMDTTIVVKDGDCQCKLLETLIESTMVIHGNVVPYDTVAPQPKPMPILTPPIKDEESIWTMKDFGVFEPILEFILVLLLFVGLFLLIRHLRNSWVKEAQKSPTSGNPMTSTPVTPENARAYMQTVAERQLGPNVRLTGPVESGRLTAKNAKITFSDGPKRRNLNNEPAFRALGQVDGEPEVYIYFLQRCGNDARSGEYILVGDDFIWIPDPVQPEALVHSNQEAEQATAQASVTPATAIPADPEKVVKAIIETALAGAGDGEVVLHISFNDCEIDFTRKSPSPKKKG